MNRFTAHRIVSMMLLSSWALMIFISAHAAGQVRLDTIWEDEAHQYHQWLDLTDDELAIAQAVQRTYHERAEAELFPLLREAGTTIRNALNASNSPAEWNYDAHGLFVKAFQLQDQALEALRRHDDVYFRDLAAIVDDEKKIERLRWRRMRLIFQLDRGELPGGNVDLFRILDGMEQRLSSEVLLRVNEWREQWEPQFITLLSRAVKTSREGHLLYAKFADANARLRDERFETQPAGHWQRIVDDYRDLVGFAPLLARKVELRTFVETRLAELEKTLDPASAYEVETRFLEESFPEVYPDPASAERLYKAAFALEDLTPEQREALGIVRWEFRIEHHRLSSEICHALRRFRHDSVQPRHMHPNAPDWRMVQHEIGAKREQLNLDQVERLRRILIPEQFQRLPEWDFKKNPPLRPWNFRDNNERRRVHREGVSGPDTPRPNAPGFHE